MARNGAEIEQRTRQSATADEEIRVKKAIKELFPKIPEDALHEIFQKAWQEVGLIFLVRPRAFVLTITGCRNCRQRTTSALQARSVSYRRTHSTQVYRI